ncbi:hypothetical protein H7J77_03620 [Mycolicibacillus parakoreensis]|uniref:Uncharacterized protein n=1 Tax=Mycolicibacillus parakoreensis TaxID=1069221 RepID=A0ABY3TZB8_9MYCO|nr:hypothetical protein [Mycolicibacillus parakoreensis]MCV7314635.1 hypothetical protein [Mycolicibacillus parakoreensis]ULN53048.1 hypothetical protein MIU77_01290 [Mycolicibacillus parakoreensis]HLS00192.1 hypothetical protein [Mycolicibacillus parakoreensis]
MRAEEGDESITEFADDAADARDRVAPDAARPHWWQRLLGALGRRRD